MTGTITSTPTTPTAAEINPQRTNQGSCSAVRRCVLPAFACVLAAIAIAPPFQQIDDDQHRERDDQQHHRDSCRFTVGKLLQSSDDQHWCDLSSVGHVSRNE